MPSEEDTMPALSSSIAIIGIPIEPFELSRCPFTATMAVRWKPDVLLPSMTVFLIMCTSLTGVAFSSMAICSPIFSASGLSSPGGSSSVSTRQLFLNVWYSKERSFANSAWDASSVSPSSLMTGCSLRVITDSGFASPSGRADGQLQKSLVVSRRWCISMPIFISIPL